MFYIYILKSKKENKRYVGYTENLERRLKEHNTGMVSSTRFSRYYLHWYSGFKKKQQALDFEVYLKTGSGIAFMNRHL